MTQRKPTSLEENKERGLFAPDRRQVQAEDAFLEELGRRVRTMRAMRGMSRKTLSRVSGISERYIAQLEAGQGNVSIILLRRVSAAMGTRIEDLVSTSPVNAAWAIIRDLLQEATPASIADAKAALLPNRGSTFPPARAGRSLGVALIGLRGAGKSTLGRILADELGWCFIELNKRIESENALAVPEIIALYGQEGFRRLEQNALRGVLEEKGPLVLATGGGIVAEPVTFDLVLSSFFTVWLKARPEEHMERVRNQGDLRPMADDRLAMQELRTILVSREPHYARAAAEVDTSGRSIDESAEELVTCVTEAMPLASGLNAGQSSG